MTDPVGRPTVTPGQLAQYRGCWSFNDCYFECCDAAAYTLDEAAAGRLSPEGLAELADAARWSATQKWDTP